MADSEVNLAIASLTFSILSFLVMVIGLTLIFYPGLRETVQSAVSGTTGAASGGFIDNLKVAALLGGALSPDIVLLIGFISDLMNLKFRFSVTSLIGILAVVLHWIVGGMFFGFSKGATSAVASAASAVTAAVAATATPAAAAAAPTPTAPAYTPQLFGVGVPTPAPRVRAPKNTALGQMQRSRPARRGSVSPGGMSVLSDLDNAGKAKMGGALPDYIAQKFNPCAIRGLGWFDIQGSPMGLAALSAIFMVYLLDMTVGNKRSNGQVGGYIGFAGAVFALNVFAYRELKCVDASSWGATLKALALPLAVGLASGGIGYSVLKSHYANFLPLDGEHFDSTAPAASANVSPSQAHCDAPNDQDQMVCDAYQNGKRITTVTA